MRLTALYRCTAVREHHTTKGEPAQLLEFASEGEPDWFTTREDSNYIFMVVKDPAKWNAIKVGDLAKVSMEPFGSVVPFGFT